MKEVHFISIPCCSQAFTIGISACGVVVPTEEYRFATQNKKKVTCENCKKTKVVRIIKSIKGDKMKKKHGWILQDIVLGFVDRDGRDYTHELRGALVFSTRVKARENKAEVGETDEVVRKVRLYRNGKAKKIIPGR